ncbi:MAG: winged helix DNA-binding domain-containing protein [Blastococcus sp.]
MTSSSELGLLRLVAQRIAGPPHPAVADAVRALTAVQGQDYPGALTSVALRTAGRRRAEAEAALDAGHVVRSWPMRGTLHLVAADDLRWLVHLLGPRVLAGASGRRERLGLTDADVERGRTIAVGALEGGGRLRRDALLTALADAGVDVTGQRGYHLLWYLAQSGTLCLGPTEAGQQLFVLLDEWVPASRPRERDEALGELALRYFTGHGPATVKDLARWAGLPLGDVRAGLAVARPHLAAVEFDGVEYFLAPATVDLLATVRREARGVFLLPGFDEFVLGYADRTAVLDPAFADRIVPGNNGMFRPTVVSAGRIVGTWAWAGRGERREVTSTPFAVFPRHVAAAIERLAGALP